MLAVEIDVDWRRRHLVRKLSSKAIDVGRRTHLGSFQGLGALEPTGPTKAEGAYPTLPKIRICRDRREDVDTRMT